MKHPKISILIPVYNAESSINQCIESVLTQPMSELEIICINDGSTDDSLKVLEEYAQKDNRVRIISQPNRGPGVALNIGLREAKGEFIHFFDSDDFLTENAYEKAYEILCDNNLDYLKVKAHPVDAFTGAPIAGAIADKYALAMMSHEDYIKPISFAQSPEKFTKSPVFAPWSGIYRRSFLIENNVRFSELYAFADHLFYYGAASHAERVLAAEIYILYHRMNNSNSLVGSYLNRFGDHFKSYNEIQKYCRFLPQKAQSMILSSELESIFLWYHKMLSGGDAKKARWMMSEFVRSTDVSSFDEMCKNALWYLEYQMILHNITDEKPEISHAENTEFIEEIRKRIPQTVGAIQPCSRVIIYGAGTYGQRIFRLLKSSRFCDIVLVVDKNWEKLLRDDMPVASPDSIAKTVYDHILIAAENPKSAHEMRRLCGAAGCL